ncbi:MAG: amidohydrolase family protein [Acidimicrobiales bacterium]
MAEPIDPEPPTDHGVDLLIAGDWVVTMDEARTMIRDGAVAVGGDRIVDVGPRRDLAVKWPAARRIGGAGRIVVPGFVNAHQHLTGDRLARSTIPDSVQSSAAIFEWAVPLHAAHDGDDDELSATAALVDAVTKGITFTVEAGTVGHPERLLAAFDRVGVGGTLGSWGSDTAGLPFSGDVATVIDRQRHVLEVTAGHPSVRGWVTLVGHDLMTDDLVVAASDLARAADTQLTFHLSPTAADAEAYLARTGSRPLVHLARLGALGTHVLIAHCVHVDDAEVDVLVGTDAAVACCPWAYLRLGQGVTTAGRHDELVDRGGRVAIGCDTENAGDRVDVLAAAALATGLARDRRGDFAAVGAHSALELATIAGAKALGLGHELGSLEPRKRADVVVIDTTSPAWSPMVGDPVLSLVWGPGATSVSDVVCGGRIVVSDGRCTTVDTDQLRDEVQAASDRLLRRAGVDLTPRWPISD